MKTVTNLLTPALAAMLAALAGTAHAQYTFYTIDAPGAVSTSANSNSTHEIAGEFDDANGDTHGFVLNKGQFAIIDIDGAIATTINGINAPGKFAGTYFDAEGTPHAFLWSKSLVTTLDRNVEIELESELCRGRTVVDRWRRTDRPANAHVGVDLDADGFFDLLVERIGRLG